MPAEPLLGTVPCAQLAACALAVAHCCTRRHSLGPPVVRVGSMRAPLSAKLIQDPTYPPFAGWAPTNPNPNMAAAGCRCADGVVTGPGKVPASHGEL